MNAVVEDHRLGDKEYMRRKSIWDLTNYVHVVIFCSATK